MTAATPIAAVKRDITDNRIRKLLRDYHIPEVADILDVPQSRVWAIWKTMPRRWMLIDFKTGQRWNMVSERSCYFHAQLKGLTDYTFGRAV
jgi:hypothetical protein